MSGSTPGHAPLRIGSRASPLARWQAEWVASRVDCPTVLVWVRSGGDADRRTPLADFGGVGVFTQALHRAMADDRADCAVHSLKDLPVEDEEGTLLACVPERADPRDALVARDDRTLASLPEGASVGTGSPRRSAQLLRRRPDLAIVPIRGNVDTRLDKVRRGDLDGVVLAIAGLRRLGHEDRVTEVFEPDVMLPAAGQGALGITIRRGDVHAEACLAPIRDVRAAAAVTAERAALHRLGAGCHAPVGALGVVADGVVTLRVRAIALDGRSVVEGEAHGPLSEAARVGRDVAEDMLARGAGPLVAAT